MNISFNPARNDLTIAMVLFSKIDQGRNQQGLLLHQTKHLESPKHNGPILQAERSPRKQANP